METIFFRTKSGEKQQVKEIVLLGGAGFFSFFQFL
jgi:hypothetical protein